MEEMWKDIPDYEGLYQVSNMGRIRRMVFINQYTTKPMIRIRKAFALKNGYLAIVLHKDGGEKSCYVHRLVAEAFCEKNGGNVVNHLDCNRQNNVASNLEWCTCLENNRYTLKLNGGLKPSLSKTNTNERYINFKNGKFVVLNKKIGIYHTFKTLEEAIKYRDEAIKQWSP